MLTISSLFEIEFTDKTDDPRIRKNIYPGLEVLIVLKKDQPTGKLTRGKVKKILTNKNYHPRGIKVMLDDNRVGRVQKIIKK